MKASEQGIALIKKFEGCSLTAYQDSAGIWTIGYGHTLHVHAGDVITHETADVLLQSDVNRAGQAVNKQVKISLNQNQFDALVSFVFNLGESRFMSSTLLEKLNQGDLNGAAREFLRWDHAGHRVLPGLARRRADERALFLS